MSYQDLPINMQYLQVNNYFYQIHTWFMIPLYKLYLLLNQCNTMFWPLLPFLPSKLQHFTLKVLLQSLLIHVLYFYKICCKTQSQLLHCIMFLPYSYFPFQNKIQANGRVIEIGKERYIDQGEDYLSRTSKWLSYVNKIVFSQNR